jgi:hypothetical protein
MRRQDIDKKKTQEVTRGQQEREEREQKSKQGKGQQEREEREQTRQYNI